MRRFQMFAKLSLAAFLLAPSGVQAAPWMQLTSAIAPTEGGGGLYNATLANRVVDGSGNVTYDPIGTIQWLCIDYYNMIYRNTWVEIKLNAIDANGLQSSRFSAMNDSNNDSVSGGPGDFQYDLGGSYNALQRYQMVAYLASQFWSVAGGNSPDKETTLNDIQKALWTITTPYGYTGTPSSSGMSAWLAQATSVGLNQSSDFYAAWKIVSEYPLDNLIGPNNYWQEGITSTPEPGFWALLALGIGGVFYAARRRECHKSHPGRAVIPRLEE